MKNFNTCADKIIKYGCCGLSKNKLTALTSIIVGIGIGIGLDIELEYHWESPHWLVESVVDSSIVMAATVLTDCLLWSLRYYRGQGSKECQGITSPKYLMFKLIPIELAGLFLGLLTGGLTDLLIEKELKNIHQLFNYLTPFVVSPVQIATRYGLWAWSGLCLPPESKSEETLPLAGPQPEENSSNCWWWSRTKFGF